MPSLRRVAFLIAMLIGPALMGGLFSCNTCNPTPKRFQIQQYQPYLQNVKVEQKIALPPTDTLTAGDTVSSQKLRIVVVGKELRVAALAAREMNGGFRAWACDPAYTALDTLEQISVLSTQDYANVKAGNDLSAFLSISGDVYEQFQQSLSDFLSQPYNPSYSLYALRFNRTPNRIAEHQFTITIRLNSSKVFVMKTAPVVITP